MLHPCLRVTAPWPDALLVGRLLASRSSLSASLKMKKIVVRVGLGLLVLLLIALIALFLALDSVVKKGFNTLGPDITKVDTRLGGAAISPFSGSGELHDLFVGNPSSYKAPSAIEAGDIHVRVKLGSLFSDKLVVERVRIKDAKITFEGGLIHNNLNAILANVQESSKRKDSSDPTASHEMKLEVDDLLIQGASISVHLNKLGGQSLTLPLPELHLQNLGAGPEGITAAALTDEILSAVITGATEAVAKGLLNLGPDAFDFGKSGTDKVKKAAKGLRDLLKSNTN
jgi:hypothetical protein